VSQSVGTKLSKGAPQVGCDGHTLQSLKCHTSLKESKCNLLYIRTPVTSQAHHGSDGVGNSQCPNSMVLGLAGLNYKESVVRAWHKKSRHEHLRLVKMNWILNPILQEVSGCPRQIASSAPKVQ